MKGSSRKKVIGIMALIFGILVIIKPSLLSMVVGIYLIIVGLTNLME